MHRDVARFEKENRGDPTIRLVAHRRHAGVAKPRGARGGDQQAADQACIRQLPGRNAEKLRRQMRVRPFRARRNDAVRDKFANLTNAE